MLDPVFPFRTDGSHFPQKKILPGKNEQQLSFSPSFHVRTLWTIINFVMLIVITFSLIKKRPCGIIVFEVHLPDKGAESASFWPCFHTVIKIDVKLNNSRLLARCVNTINVMIFFVNKISRASFS